MFKILQKKIILPDCSQHKNPADIIKLLDLIVITGLGMIIFTIPFKHINAFKSIGVAMVCIGWLSLKVRFHNWKVRSNPLLLPLLLFFITILISIVSCYYLNYTQNKIISEFIRLTVLFIIIADYCDTRNKVAKIFLLFLLANIASLIYFGFQFFYHNLDIQKFSQAISTGQWISNGTPRISTYFLFAVTFIYAAFFYIKGLKLYAGLTVLFLLNLFFLIATNQRAPLLACFCVFVSLSLIYKKNIKKILIAILLTILFSGIIITATPLKSMLIHENWSQIKKLDFSIKDKSDSLVLRLQIQRYVLQYLKKHPFTGVGYGRKNFDKVIAESKELPPRGFNHAHNAFLNLALHTGIQGLLAFILILFVQFKMAWKGNKEACNEFDKYFFTASMLYIIGFWVRMQFDDVVRRGIALNYWIIIGLMTSLFLNLETERAEYRHENKI